MIPDEIYDEKFEGNTILALLGNYVTSLNETQHQFFISLVDENLNLLQELQDIHDRFPVENWKKRLDNIAKKHHLTIPQL